MKFKFLIHTLLLMVLSKLGVCLKIYANLINSKTIVNISHTHESDLIRDLKAKIYCQEGILPSEQTLKYKGITLPDPDATCDFNLLVKKLLVDYNIVEGDIIQVEQTKSQIQKTNPIKIYIEHYKQTKLIKVDKLDLIKDVKAKLYCQEDIEVNQLNLFFNDELLLEARTLDSYNIKDESVLKTEKIFKDYLNNGVYYECKAKGKIALTFDDGPSEYTDKILDLFKIYNIKANFFVTGGNINTDERKNTIRRIYNEGHLLGSHTWSHPDLTCLSNMEIEQELNKTSDLIFDIVGVRPRYFRPPFGSINDNVIKKVIQMGYKIVLWNLDTEDWRLKHSSSLILRKYNQALQSYTNTMNSWIVLQHDIHQETMLLQERIIQYIIKKDFEIVSLNDCIQDSLLPYSN